jgi:hypothetical protein
MGHFLVKGGRHMPVGEYVEEVQAATAATAAVREKRISFLIFTLLVPSLSW